MAKIDRLLKLLPEHNASDLHMTPGDPPIVRLNGVLRRTSLDALTSEVNKNMFYEIMDSDQIALFESNNDVDMSYEITGVSRYRGNIFRQNNGVCAVFRMIPSQVFSADQLGVGETIRNFTNLKNGLVLVTGPTGSGKSTTLASLIDLINTTRRMHIITIEDPLEFVHEEKMSIISHREVGRHTRSFASALRAAMREDPDVILVGEMRDLETISLALTAAEMGVLVFGTLHTNSAPKTINRIIDVFPENQQEQVRTMLASSLKGVVAQQLLKRHDKKGRVAAHEILVVNPGVGNLIREGKSHQISSIMETSKQEGNCTMDQTLMNLVREGKITARDAFYKALNKGLFEKLMESEDKIEEAVASDSNSEEILQVSLPAEENKEDLKNFMQGMMSSGASEDASKDTLVMPSQNPSASSETSHFDNTTHVSSAAPQNISADESKPPIEKPSEPLPQLKAKETTVNPAPSSILNTEDKIESSSSAQAPSLQQPPADSTSSAVESSEAPAVPTAQAEFLAMEGFLARFEALVSAGNENGLVIILELNGMEENGACTSGNVIQVIKKQLDGDDFFTNATTEVFVIVCPNGDAGKSKKLYSALATFFGTLGICVRVGDARYPDEGSDADALIEQASEVKYF